MLAGWLHELSGTLGFVDHFDIYILDPITNFANYPAAAVLLVSPSRGHDDDECDFSWPSDVFRLSSAVRAPLCFIPLNFHCMLQP